jgi:hypothetical protein
LVLARETVDGFTEQLVLRSESLSPHVGWFVQSRIAIDAEQAAALKMTLTSGLIDGGERSVTPRLGQEQEYEPASTTLKLHSAMAG